MRAAAAVLDCRHVAHRELHVRCGALQDKTGRPEMQRGLKRQVKQRPEKEELEWRDAPVKLRGGRG